MNKPYSLMREKFVSTELRNPPEAVFVQDVPCPRCAELDKQYNALKTQLSKYQHCDNSLPDLIMANVRIKGLEQALVVAESALEGVAEYNALLDIFTLSAVTEALAKIKEVKG